MSGRGPRSWRARLDRIRKRAAEDQRIPPASYARHAEPDPQLEFEAALRAGDLDTAETHARRMAGFTPSWMDAISGAGDVRAHGALGLARVSRARGQLALVIKHVDACLRLASNQPEALLLGAANALDLGLDAKAKAYHRALTKAAPFERISIDDVDRDMVEARLAPRGRYAFAQRANAAFEEGLFEEATRAYGSVFGSRALPRLNAAWSDLAARYLFALASVERLETLAQLAERILAKSPGFVTAREALAFTLARRGAADAAQQQYAGTGLERLFDEKLSFARWRKLPPSAALSPIGVTAESRAQLLLEKGAWTAALALLGTLPKVVPDSPVRFLVAGSIWHATTLARPKRRAKCAEEAWAWLEPLAMKAPRDNTYAFETPVLAAELLIRTGRFDELLRLPIPDEIRSYPALTMRAYARLLPHRLDALLALARPQQVLDELTEFFDDAGKAERDNEALVARLALAERALGHPPTSRKTSVPHPDDEARALSNRAWTLEQRGRFDEAIDAYIRVAELHPEISAIGLANAGNLLRIQSRYALAFEALEAASALAHHFPMASRAPVLDKVASWLMDRSRHADAIPVLALAFEACQSSGRAGRLARCYDAIGDQDRAQLARTRGHALEPRDPALVPADTKPKPKPRATTQRR